jgi:hypothetical protein
MARRRSPGRAPEQFSLPEPPPAKRKGVVPTPEQIAKGAVAKRGKPSAVAGNVKLTMTFDLKRALAERLSARAIRAGVSVEAVILGLVRDELGP